MNKKITSKNDFLSLLSLVEDSGEKLYFRYELNEEQTKRNRGYSHPVQLWVQKVDGKFNMQGGYGPAYFNESHAAMRRVLDRMWDTHVAHGEVIVHVDPMDFSDLHQYEISRSIDRFQDGAAIYLSHRSGLIKEKFESHEEIAAFIRNCKLIPDEAMMALTNKISSMLVFVIDYVKARDDTPAQSNTRPKM